MYVYCIDLRPHQFQTVTVREMDFICNVVIGANGCPCLVVESDSDDITDKETQLGVYTLVDNEEIPIAVADMVRYVNSVVVGETQIFHIYVECEDFYEEDEDLF